MWNLKCAIVPVIIGATGIVTRSLRKNLEAVPGKHSIDSLQKTAILGTSHNLRVFERQILWKIFGPVNIDNIWRIRNNMENDKLIEGADIVRFSKAQIIKWLGHVQRMNQARPARKLIDWKPMGIRPVGRPRQRWQEDVMEDLKKLNVKNWKAIRKDGRTGRDLVEKAKTHKGL